MSTLTRRSSGNRVPEYKDYMSFVSGYRNGKKENEENEFILSQNKSVPEVAGFSGKVCDSYSSFLEKTKNKKFSSVKPPSGPSQSYKEPPKQTVKVKTEIFIEINDDKNPTTTQEDSVAFGQVEAKKKMFEGNTQQDTKPTQSKIKTLKQKLESNNQTENHQKHVPPKQIIKRINSFNNLQTESTQSNSNCDKSDTPDGHKTEEAQNVLNFHLIEKKNNELQRSDITTKDRLIGQLNEALKFKSSITVEPEDKKKDVSEVIQVVTVPKEFSSIPPPPPMPNGFKPPININKPKTTKQDQRRVTENRSPPLVPSKNETDQKNEWNSQKSATLDRSNPLVRKLAYGAMLDMYGAYHEKANSYVSTLPRQNVKKDNGLQKIIDSIAAQGGLEKLSGRSNPKAENE